MAHLWAVKDKVETKIYVGKYNLLFFASESNSMYKLHPRRSLKLHEV